MYLPHTETSMGIASLISLVPALTLSYLILKKYTYPTVEKPFFSDSKLFLLLTIGFLEGTLLSIPLTYILPSYVKGYNGLKVMLAFGTLTEVTKLVTINVKKLSGKSDTIFYGFGLGIGMGASIGIKLVYYFINAIKVDTISWIILIVVVIQHILIHASTGTVIGEGVTKHKPFKFTTLAIILAAIFQTMTTITFSIAKHSYCGTVCVIISASAILAVIFHSTTFNGLSRIANEATEKNK